MKTEEIIEVKPIGSKSVEITIVGDGDIVLNKMNDRTTRTLADARKGKSKGNEAPNVWEDIITSIHWYNEKPKNFTKDGLEEALLKNAPCISAFGLKKSLNNAVVRYGLDKYATKFDASTNIIAKGGLIPIKFSEHYIDEKLMSPKKGAPVLVNLNRFCGWSATFTIKFMDNVYSLEQIIEVTNLAGFGIGIGSGRTSGYGRYHVESIK